MRRTATLDLDLRKPLAREDLSATLRALALHAVVRIPNQSISGPQLKAFASQFGSLEINVANAFQEPGHPEVMILSNVVRDGRPIGIADAGQDWHTDMSYSETVAFLNVLLALQVPQRDGKPLGDTQFADMQAAYEGLPDEIKTRLEGATAVHDFNKFWEKMRSRPGSAREPLTPEQRRKKPPVSHPVFLSHPISGAKVLYANPGYVVRLEGFSDRESDELLAFLFEHQVKDEYVWAHHWTVGDVLVWDDLQTLHRAVPDYGPSEPRLVKRCQVMADRVFDPAFARLGRPSR